MHTRFVNIFVGAWLYASAFLWPHTRADFINTATCGVLAACFAVLALRRPLVHWLEIALSIWLVVGTLAVRTLSTATIWSNLSCAAVIYVVALLPSQTLRKYTGGSQRGSA